MAHSSCTLLVFRCLPKRDLSYEKINCRELAVKLIASQKVLLFSRRQSSARQTEIIQVHQTSVELIVKI